MARAFRVLWAALKDLLDEFWILAVCNVLWAFCSIPLLLLAIVSLLTGNIWLAVVMTLFNVILMAPATTALCSIAQRAVEGRAGSIRIFLGEMRYRAVKSWRLLGVWTIGLMIIVFDLSFYSSMQGNFGVVMTVFWMYLLVIWGAFLIYLFPLLLLQEKPRLRTLARNTFVMTMGYPVFTFTTLALMLVAIVISLLVPILPIFLTAALLAVWSMRATQELITVSEARRAPIANPEDAAAATTTEKGRRGQVRPR